MAKVTVLFSNTTIKCVDKWNINFNGEIKTVFICECSAYDMVTENGLHLHTSMEAVVSEENEILIPTKIVDGEAVATTKVMHGDIIFAASDKFMSDFWLKFDKKKQAAMIHIIIARTAALMSGVTCMTDLYEETMKYMSAASNDMEISRGKVIAALKKINAYEEKFCKKYLKELSKADIGLEADPDAEFGEYNDEDDDCECCCG